MKRALSCLGALSLACGGPMPLPDAGPSPPDARPPTPDAGTDAGPPPPVCSGEWWPGSLGEPTITTFAPVSTAAPFSDAEIRLRNRALRAEDGADVELREVPRDRFVLLHIPRAHRALAMRCAIYWEPLGGDFVLARLGSGCPSERARYLGPLLPGDKLGAWPSDTDAIEVARMRGDRIAIEHVAGGIAQARAIARESDVLTVDPWRTPQPTADVQRTSVQADALQGFALVSGLPQYDGLSGRGIRAAIDDTGVVPTHPDLQRYDEDGAPIETRVFSLSDSFGDDGGWHATLVSGLLGGNGWSSDAMDVSGRIGTPFGWRGIAPELESFKAIVTSVDFAPWTLAFDEPAAHLVNCSHTATTTGAYAGYARAWEWVGFRGALEDLPARPRRPVIFSAGNNGAFHSHPEIPVRGYYGVTSPMKNALVVGGSNANDASHSAGAACGPTLDGRFKPDLVAGGYVDWRPLDGALVALEEVRVAALEGSGAPDLVWTPISSEGWILGPDLAAGELDGNRLLFRAFGDGAALRFDVPAGLDAAAYASVSIRFEVLDAGDPAFYRAPHMLGVLWDSDANASLDRAGWDEYGAGSGVRTHTYALPSYFEGTAYAIEIRPAVTVSNTVILNRGEGYTTTGGGTSLAAPIASGVVALLLEQLSGDHAFELELAPPLPSTLKAILIHSARDLVRLEPPARDPLSPDTGQALVYHRGPDWPTGFGLIDAVRASTLVDSHDAAQPRWIEHPIADGEIHSYEVPVMRGSGPLTATLVWDDYPGSAVTDSRAVHLVNDLDLVAISPDGVAHGPWTLARPPLNADPLADGVDPISSSDIVPAERCASVEYWDGEATAACEDHLNNVEQVAVDAPEPGIWTIRIRGDVLQQGQDYTLVVSQSCQ